MSYKLKPCPFCGGEVCRDYHNDSYTTDIGCANCGYELRFTDEDWNTRCDSNGAIAPKQESKVDISLRKEKVEFWKCPKCGKETLCPPCIVCDEQEPKPELVDETMGKLVIEQDEPKPEAKDEIQEIIGRAVCQGYPCKICEDKGICPKEIQIENGLKVKQARQELARWFIDKAKTFGSKDNPVIKDYNLVIQRFAKLIGGSK